MILVNAESRVIGRLATFVAKKALEGEEIVIVNAEKAIMTGSKRDAVRKIRSRLDIRGKGNPEKGPKFSRMPDRVLRRAVRGMLPWKSIRGRDAYKKVHAYIGMPQEFEGKAFTGLPERKVKRFVELGMVCRLLGAKW